VLAIERNIKAVPVIDHRGKFLGVVPSDGILAILHEEHIEDALHFAGIRPFDGGEVFKASITTHIKKRLPWLLIGLIGGIAAARFIGIFDALLEAELALAAFIPMIVYLADAIGSQTQTIFIRSISFGGGISLQKVFLREGVIGAVMACIFGLLSALIAGLWWESAVLAWIIGISVTMTIIIATVIAIFLPWFFLVRNIDPAIASGPLATVVRDILSIAIYFGIAMVVFSFA
jgi:magnesium transporter